jgi:hypothetical protein
MDARPGGSSWTLLRTDQVGSLVEGRAGRADADVHLPAAKAWRWFTGAAVNRTLVEQFGDAALTEHVLAARSIIV